jgi:hypothetical protein
MALLLHQGLSHVAHNGTKLVDDDFKPMVRTSVESHVAASA